MTCQTCGSDKQENFCPQCGEKKFDPHSLTFKHAAVEVIEGFTHADHTFFGTIKKLLFRPGLLSLEYINGRRVKYMKPLGLFLVLNLAFFVLPSNNSFNQPLSTFLHYDNYRMFGTKEAVDQKLISTGQSYEEFEKDFNTSMRASSKGYVIVLVPMYALIFGLLMVRKKRKVMEHVIFALHFISFMLLYFLIYLFIIVMPLIWILGAYTWEHSGDLIASGIGLFILGIYVGVGFRAFYGVRKVWSVAASILSMVLFVAVMMGYRMFLFYKIVAFAH